jgi:high-affinity nickel-transport protein
MLRELLTFFYSGGFRSGGAETRRRIGALYLVLVAANLIAWAWAFLAFRGDAVLLGTALLAYGFGLRHAVDADHIAAIDNVTRKLMQEGKRPVCVGFYFSLGHSTVVIIATAGIVVTAGLLQDRFAALKELGELIGTSVSALFLFAIAIVNLVVLTGVWRSVCAVRRGERLIEDDLNLLLAGRGLMGRLFRPLFAMIGKSWHMYPLGFLFGLGFDTATEIGLLGIAAAEVSHGLSPNGLSQWTILVFPALFTAGMALVDTTDGVLMLGAYGWAFVKPIRKLYYNLVITAVSVAVALLVGGIETLGIIAGQLGLDGGVWVALGAINDNFAALGYAVIGLFVASWLVSIAVYRRTRLDEVEIAVE